MSLTPLRSRASTVSLGLPFMGPSVVPDGSLAQGDRQAIGYGYYDILAGSAFVTIGGTSQIEAVTSTGGITLERMLGGTSQIGPITSTGTITLERVLGGTSQIGSITSTGTITLERALGGALPTRNQRTIGFVNKNRGLNYTNRNRQINVR